MEWVEAIGPTVDAAVKAALEDLGVASVDDVEVEVLQDASPGFLGMGGRQAMVKVTQKPRKRTSRRRSRKGGGKQQQRSEQRSAKAQQRGKQGDKPKQQKQQKQRSKEQSAKHDGERRTMDTSDNGKRERPEPAPIEDQAAVATAFLDGLLAAFGLEGSVESRIEDEVLYLDVTGEQTEALVGPKGATMYSVLELTRTTVQRKTFGAPRMRIDIAGYGARRREALSIYTRKLADQVLADGGEIMLEPMNAADRKVVHDAAAEIDGIRTHSEGDDPRRAVVISPAED
jgi:spoIIIJ-associated protein